MRKYWVLIVCVGGLVSIPPFPSVAAGDRAQPRATSSPDAAAGKAYLKNWHSFRGPKAIGLAPFANPPLKWNIADGSGVLWKIALPKHGMSSPIVWEDRIFLTGADEDSRQFYCVDADTGKLLWQHDVDGVPNSPNDGKIPEVLQDTGYAAPTPTTDGKHVAAVFATGELVCLNLEGKRQWIKHLGIPQNHYGHASSLLCHEDRLFVQFDQRKNSQLLAFELATGKLVWQVKRGAMSWSSPILAENKGTMELILTNSKAVEGYDPTSGKKLWRVECLDGEVASSAAFAEGIVFVGNEGAAASAIDVSSREPKILWQWDESLPDCASPVANGQYLIVPTAFGVVTCLDVRMGNVLWEHEFDEGFCSSPIFVNGRVYIIDLSGIMHIFKLDDEFELLGAADFGEPAYATPAFVGDRIYVRTLDHLYCVGSKPK